jgi:hypothetical protein
LRQEKKELLSSWVKRLKNRLLTFLLHKVKKKDAKPYLRDKEGNVLASIVDPKLLRIKSDMSTFVAETRGKKKYSKKLEIENTPPLVPDEDETLKALFGFRSK